MRLALVIVILLAASTTRASLGFGYADACRYCWYTFAKHSPVRDDLPLRGVIFVAADGEHEPDLAWRRGRGRARITSLPRGVHRIDYVAADDAVLDVNDISYTIAVMADSPRAPRSVSLHRTKDPCTPLYITTDGPVAALKARIQHGHRITEYLLVDQIDHFELRSTTCARWPGLVYAAPPVEGLLGMFAILSDGSEHRISRPVEISSIPVRD